MVTSLYELEEAEALRWSFLSMLFLSDKLSIETRLMKHEVVLNCEWKELEPIKLVENKL